MSIANLDDDSNGTIKTAGYAIHIKKKPGLVRDSEEALLLSPSDYTIEGACPTCHYTIYSLLMNHPMTLNISVKKRDSKGRTTDDVAFVSSGNNQAEHNSSFQQFINFRAPAELKTAVKTYLEADDTATRFAELEQEAALLR